MKKVFAVILSVLFIFLGVSANAEVAEKEKAYDYSKAPASQELKRVVEQLGGVVLYDGVVYDYRAVTIPEELKKYWDNMSMKFGYLCSHDDAPNVIMYCFQLVPLNSDMPEIAVSIHEIGRSNAGGLPYVFVKGVIEFVIRDGDDYSTIFKSEAKKQKEFCTIQDPCDMSPCIHDKEHCEHQQKEKGKKEHSM